MDVLLDYLFILFDPCVLFCCLVFCSVRLQLSVPRPNCSQVVRIEHPCISVS